MKKIKINLTDLRSEYESTYLAYVPKRIKERNGHFSFSEWAKKEKGIEIPEVNDIPVKDSNPFNLSAAGLKKAKKELKRIKKFGYGV